jgi:hypothetical protein
MNFMFYLEPFFEIERPFLMNGWLEWYSKISRQLRGEYINYSCRLVCFESIVFFHNNEFSGNEIKLSINDLRGGGGFYWVGQKKKKCGI